MPPPNSLSNDLRGRYRRATIALAVVAFLWLVVLPTIGRLEPVRDFIDANESRDINPGAMYYTELEAMPRIIDEVDRTRENASEAFWRPSRTKIAR